MAASLEMFTADVPGLAESTKEWRESGKERDRILRDTPTLSVILPGLSQFANNASDNWKAGKVEPRRILANPGESVARLTSARYHD
ncbi:MAG TPA: hypothetical protein VN946_02365 [Terriglobales bacterium]|nr:hypothetical protein [Terriglobales bacterium]